MKQVTVRNTARRTKPNSKALFFSVLTVISVTCIAIASLRFV